MKTKFPVLAIFPLLIFVFVFLGSGIYYNDFYVLPSPVAAFIGITAAFILLKARKHIVKCFQK